MGSAIPPVAGCLSGGVIGITLGSCYGPAEACLDGCLIGSVGGCGLGIGVVEIGKNIQDHKHKDPEPIHMKEKS